MKKALVIFLALALVMGLSAPALAAEDDYRQTHLYFYYGVTEPIYTVTIPDGLYLEFGNNYLEIVVEGVDDLMGKLVTITFEGTQLYYEDLEAFGAILWPNGEYEGDSVNYHIRDSLGRQLGFLEGSNYYPAGGVLAEFTENSTQAINLYVYPIQSYVKSNVEYTGYIIFGISLR